MASHWATLVSARVASYRREWLSRDIIAGLSVAAVALPIGMAYAQIAGFLPEVGIYAAIFPPLAYALVGTSRQLIVNPDSACCAILAATLAPLAAPGTERYGDELAAKGTVLAVARAKGFFRVMLDRSGLADRIGREHLFPTVHEGAAAFAAK
jgi:MFS superfamily sulfate permease-like transporter